MTATIVLLIIAALIALSAGLLFVLPWAVHRAEKRRRHLTLLGVRDNKPVRDR